MEKQIYLDNSSTTKPCKKAVEYTALGLERYWGNPSSLHILGIEAQIEVDKCRERAAAVIRANPQEIVFTGSGTEANNMALLGAAYKGRRRGKRIVCSAIEHPSVLNTVKRLENDGFEVVRLKPQSNGVVAEEELEKAINSDTILVSLMLVNNELGAIQPVAAAAELIKRCGAPALLHCDAVQAFGKIPISVKKLGVDLLSASGHKIHGPKGIGLLYIKKGVHIPELISGGGQEGGLRSGTEPVPAIMGLSGALEELGNIEKNLERLQGLWQYAAEGIKNSGLAKINSDENCLPYILNISVSGYRSETLLHFLEGQNVFVSSGSACAKGEGSYVLNECGLSRSLVDSALRLSFSRDTEKSDIDAFISALIAATQKLRKVNG